MAIPFTDREMERAWRENLSASERPVRSNAFRLLLFYAVECGLKAILMRRFGVQRTDDIPQIMQAQHNINRLMDELSVEGTLRLPNSIRICNLPVSNNTRRQRTINIGQINQMWRYGGFSTGDITDEILEEKLLRISDWIKRELR